MLPCVLTGLTNDCSGKRFVLELEINQIPSSRQSSLFVDQDEAFCRADFPGIEPNRYNAIHDHDYAAAVGRVMERPGCVRRVELKDVDPQPKN